MLLNVPARINLGPRPIDTRAHQYARQLMSCLNREHTTRLLKAKSLKIYTINTVHMLYHVYLL